MDDVSDATLWRMRALAVASRMRADDPTISSQAIAHEVMRTVEGAPSHLDPILQRIRSWQRMGALPLKRRAAA